MRHLWIYVWRRQQLSRDGRFYLGASCIGPPVTQNTYIRHISEISINIQRAPKQPLTKIEYQLNIIPEISRDLEIPMFCILILIPIHVPRKKKQEMFLLGKSVSQNKLTFETSSTCQENEGPR